MNNFVLSIAIPAFNREKYIKRLLDGIRGEINNNVEVFVSDNASTDNTNSMMSNEFPNITYYRNDKNLGADGNFLECYKKAKGRYVWLVGSDDIITEGAIRRITDFIQEHIDDEIPLIFMNHNSFVGEYKGTKSCGKAYLNTDENDRLVDSKKELIDYAGRQLTFMSSFLVKKNQIDNIQDITQFLNTNFIQTYCALEACKNSSQFGLIFYPCVSQDLTPDNSLFYKNYSKQFHVFGSCMYEVFVNYGSKVGFDKKQLKDKYFKGMCKIFISWILKAKRNGDKDGMKVFWNEVFSNIRVYPLCWFTVIPVALTPPVLAKLYYKIKRMTA